ncbi:MAG: hypothetical protein P8103_04170 [Candidatus Thiodiazotropha sp.]
MKRQLFHFALCASLATPLLAQESYYPGYGYHPEENYDADNTSRQFNFNPGDVMNGMGNPMGNFFGSSNRRYNDYPSGGYAPPAYPPAYGYPAYPGYQPAYPGYGYPAQPPATPAYPATDAAPSGQPNRMPPGAQPMTQPPAYGSAPPAAADYQPRFANPGQADHFRFRPLEETAPPPAQASPQQRLPEPAVIPQPPEAVPPTAGYREPEPLAPLTYPKSNSYPEPMAPLTYPEAEATTPAPRVEMRDTRIQQDPGLKFRPLDKPGYSSELGE